ncbi:MAG: hypothetical protein AVDCRST_MAG89-627, partial [uncultured Gemmatimonadetes bacterium]
VISDRTASRDVGRKLGPPQHGPSAQPGAPGPLRRRRCQACDAADAAGPVPRRHPPRKAPLRQAAHRGAEQGPQLRALSAQPSASAGRRPSAGRGPPHPHRASLRV